MKLPSCGYPVSHNTHITFLNIIENSWLVCQLEMNQTGTYGLLKNGQTYSIEYTLRWPYLTVVIPYGGPLQKSLTIDFIDDLYGIRQGWYVWDQYLLAPGMCCIVFGCWRYHKAYTAQELWTNFEHVHCKNLVFWRQFMYREKVLLRRKFTRSPRLFSVED